MPAFAQAPVVEGHGSTAVVAPIFYSGSGVDTPPVPKSLLELPKPGPLPPLPAGNGNLPEPAFTPAQVQVVTPQAAGDLVHFNNTAAGIGAAVPSEPAVTSIGNTVLATWNTAAGLSTDGGGTFSLRTAASVWPAVDAGPCCDQRVIYVPEHDMVIWLMQFGYSPTTQKNTYGFKVFQGQTRLTNLNGWTYLVEPSVLGFAPGRWMDFPDFAISSDHLYVSANVFDNIGTQFDSVVFRMPLAAMATGGNVSLRTWQSRRDLSGVGASYRFTQGAQHYGGLMWWASQTSSTSTAIWEVADGATQPTRADRTIAAYLGGGASAPGPDGRDWIGFNDGRITGGYATYDEIGFLWTCRQNGTTRLKPYVRNSRFKLSDRTLIADTDIASSTFAFGYPSATSNHLGQVGLVMCYNSSTTHVSGVSTVIDGVYQAWGGLTLLAGALGTHGSPSNRWGDYLSVEPSATNPILFHGTHQRQNGGTAPANTESRVVLFQREAYGLVRTPITVTARWPGGDLQMPVTATADIYGQANGTTPLARSYLTGASNYTLTAPRIFTQGAAQYCLTNWRRNGQAWSNQTTVSDSIAAQWVVDCRLVRNVDLRANIASVLISHTTDCNFRTSAVTNAIVPFGDNQSVSLVAPLVTTTGLFSRWNVQGVGFFADQALLLTMNRDYVVTAEYVPRPVGSWASVGTSCRGSDGSTPFMALGGGNPTVGGAHEHQLHFGKPSSPVWNVIGVSNTVANGLPLPFSLGVIGAPTCTMYCSQEVLVPTATDSTGRAGFTITYPRDYSLAGQTYYSQFVTFDPAANQIGLTWSQYLRITIGA